MSLRAAITPAPSLADQAFAAMVDAITSGELPPAARIKEAEIARSLGISRGPLREALSRLENNGLVERKTNLGVSVTALSLDDLDDLFRMREALEGQACGLAAARMTAADIAHLNQMLNRHTHTTARTGHYKQLTEDDDFHVYIIRRSGSRRLLRALCGDLYLQVRMYRHRSSQDHGRAKIALVEHRDIVDALASGNRHAAETAMRQHISNARENLIWAGPEIE